MLRAVWLLVVALLFLCGCLVFIPRANGGSSPEKIVAWRAASGSRLAWWLARLAVVLAIAPLLHDLQFLIFAPHPLLIGDAPSHTAIAHDLASHGLPHGWLDTYDGGFPLGVNYPPLGWALLAGLMRIGVPMTVATNGVGLLPYVIAPFAVVEIARRVGSRPVPAAFGAIVMAWISPYNFWLGTERSFLGLGLVSQSLAVAFLLFVASAVLNPKATWQPPIAGALLAASHPQVTAALCMTLALLLVVAPPLRQRIVLVFAGVVVAGIAIYGPGLATLRLPFGWIPTTFDWWIVGYPVDRLLRWFVDFELFDLDSKVPAVTSVAVLSLLILAALAIARRRVATVTLATFCWVMALTLVGRALSSMGSFGAHVLTFLQPQRAFALVPFALAAVVVVAWNEIAAIPQQFTMEDVQKKLAASLATSAPAAMLVAMGLVALPRNARWLANRVDLVRENFAGRGDCGAMASALDWTRSIDASRPGRLSSIETPHYTYECFKALGVEAVSPVPRGLSVGAGAHVGVLTFALSTLNVTDPNTGDRLSPATDKRAETMGVRWLLYGVDDRPAGAWKILQSTKEIELAERVGGTDTVGVGCISERWHGTDAELKDRLFDDLRNGGSILVDPTRLVALDQTRGPLTGEVFSPGDCDASHATVIEKRREPGAFEAEIDSPSPVDVVVRATAFPTWVIRIDGAPAPVTVVAPGFPSARMPAGKHHVEAIVSPPRFYWGGVLVGALIVVGLGFEGRRRAKKSS